MTIEDALSVIGENFYNFDKLWNAIKKSTIIIKGENLNQTPN